MKPISHNSFLVVMLFAVQFIFAENNISSVKISELAELDTIHGLASLEFMNPRIYAICNDTVARSSLKINKVSQGSNDTCEFNADSRTIHFSVTESWTLVKNQQQLLLFNTQSANPMKIIASDVKKIRFIDRSINMPRFGLSQDQSKNGKIQLDRDGRWWDRMPICFIDSFARLRSIFGMTTC